MKSVETSLEHGAVSIGAADSEFEQLTPEEARELFARTEAEGAGDYEVSGIPTKPDGFAFIDSYDAVFPEWSAEFLHGVHANITSLTRDSIRELGRGLFDSPGERQAQLDTQKISLDHRLDELLFDKPDAH